MFNLHGSLDLDPYLGCDHCLSSGIPLLVEIHQYIMKLLTNSFLCRKIEFALILIGKTFTVLAVSKVKKTMKEIVMNRSLFMASLV